MMPKLVTAQHVQILASSMSTELVKNVLKDVLNVLQEVLVRLAPLATTGNLINHLNRIKILLAMATILQELEDVNLALINTP